MSGIAKKLNTTPGVLSSSYLAALNSDPKLTFGQYVAANVIADNLKKRLPAITAANILTGLQNGDSLGRTLRKLGMASDEAKAAVREAKLQISESLTAN